MKELTQIETKQVKGKTEKLIYVEYLDHFTYKKSNVEISEIKAKLETPYTIKSFGLVKFENELYLVIENIYANSTDFILKSDIIKKREFIEKDS